VLVGEEERLHPLDAWRRQDAYLARSRMERRAASLRTAVDQLTTTLEAERRADRIGER